MVMKMDRYRDRQDAGRQLASQLMAYANHKDTIVLALPRGGVPVAYEIATILHVPLDVFIVRKLGVPGQRELAMGAIATGHAQIFNHDIIEELHISQDEIERVIAQEEIEMQRREVAYRGNHVFPSLKNKTVILVDDGIATGATIRVAIKALRQMNPAKLVVAVPVAAFDMCEKIQTLVDQFVCPLRPSFFQAVGVWYEDFAQTEDEEVHRLLKNARMLNER
jgi:putative phosphoribosyl transferase